MQDARVESGVKKLFLSVVLVLCSSACTTGSAPPGVAERPLEKGVPSDALLEKVCHAEHTDASSKVFAALDPKGEPRRLVVTPTRKIADMGNLIFDMEGSLLGHGTGSEVSWDDKVAMAEERARVDALMAGAAIPDGATSVDCR